MAQLKEKTERRRHVRVERALAIQFRIKKSTNPKADKDTWHLSMTTDMSANGVAFESAVPFGINDILELQVVMSGVLDVVRGEGKVVRVEEIQPNELYLVAVELKNHL